MKQHKTNDDLLADITQRLDDSLHSLDNNIIQNLAADRKKVISTMPYKRTNGTFKISLKQAGVFASACFFIIAASITLFSAENENNIFLSTAYDVTDDGIIIDYDLLNNLEFILWLSEEENKNENSAG